MTKIALVTDLYGASESDWWSLYEKHFSNHDITIFDSRQLAGIATEFSKETSHDLFVNGGIDRAAQKLGQHIGVDLLIGLSVGGVICWRALLLGLCCKQFVTVSATRLRYENKKPESKMTLYFGEKDPYRPNQKWADELCVDMKIIPQAEHTIYRQSAFIEKYIVAHI